MELTIRIKAKHLNGLTGIRVPTKRAYRVKIRINNKNIIATVDSINMIRLVAACEKNNTNYKVLKCLGRL